jgi:hypothetical protein
MAAVIEATRIAAGHDGAAELIVRLRYEDGGASEVTLDHLAASALMESCGAASVEQLAGHGWERVRDALAVSWNRFNASDTN